MAKSKKSKKAKKISLRKLLRKREKYDREVRHRERKLKERERSSSSSSSSSSLSSTDESARSRRRSPSTTSRRSVSPISSDASSRRSSSASSEAKERELSEPILELMGPMLTEDEAWGFPLHSKVSTAWKELVRVGLPTADRKDLLFMYPLPKNCPFLEPPKLNEELRDVLDEVAKGRDAKIVFFQQRLAAALAGIGKYLSVFLNTEEERNLQSLAPIFGAGRLLTDLFHEDTMIRRGLVMANKKLKSSMRPMLEGTQPDSFLFGSDLTEKIKQAKALAQTTAELKAPKPMMPSKNLPAPPRFPRAKPRVSSGGHSQSRRAKPQYKSSNFQRNSRPEQRSQPRQRDYKKQDRREKFKRY